jgi:hypothetical protein
MTTELGITLFRESLSAKCCLHKLRVLEQLL